MTRIDPDSPFPYVRERGLCEICGQPQWPKTFPLIPVTLEPASGGTPSEPNYRAARIIYVCSRHDRDYAVSARLPHAETRAGTDRKRPQTETLFELEPRSAIEGSE